MDIENIASLVQGELQTIRQIILQNHSLIKTMKLRPNGTLLLSTPIFKRFSINVIEIGKPRVFETFKNGSEWYFIAN